MFTTHTPVPAGNDAFGFDLMDKYFGNFYPKLGISRDAFSNWRRTMGRFSMTVLGMRFADQRNGVSELHGQVSQAMWAHVFKTTIQETPIGYITNGVHTGTWLAPERHAYFTETFRRGLVCAAG